MPSIALKTKALESEGDCVDVEHREPEALAGLKPAAFETPNTRLRFNLAVFMVENDSGLMGNWQTLKLQGLCRRSLAGAA